MWDAATSPSYDNVDMSLDVSVSALYFLCNRPTIAALMCFAQDIIYPDAPSTTAAQGDIAEPDTPRGVSPEHSDMLKTPTCAATTDSNALPHLSPNTAQDTPARSGGESRTIFKLGVAVAKLELQLGFEGYNVTPLLQCNVTDFDMNIDVHPETLLLKSNLGNVQVEDLTLAVDSPYRQSCGLRNDACESLITTEFRSGTATFFFAAGVAANCSLQDTQLVQNGHSVFIAGSKGSGGSVSACSDAHISLA